MGVFPARRGFTLVEIMVVVVIIGLLAALAVPTFQRMRTRSIATRLANDLRQYSDSFQRYALEQGGWPPVGGVSEVPAGMEGYLPAAYQEPSPLGGGFTWSGDSARLRLANATGANDEIMLRVDTMIDDGNLASGDFRTNGTDYVLQLR